MNLPGHRYTDSKLQNIRSITGWRRVISILKIAVIPPHLPCSYCHFRFYFGPRLNQSCRQYGQTIRFTLEMVNYNPPKKGRLCWDRHLLVWLLLTCLATCSQANRPRRLCNQSTPFKSGFPVQDSSVVSITRALSDDNLKGAFRDNPFRV